MHYNVRTYSLCLLCAEKPNNSSLYSVEVREITILRRMFYFLKERGRKGNTLVQLFLF